MTIDDVEVMIGKCRKIQYEELLDRLIQKYDTDASYQDAYLVVSFAGRVSSKRSLANKGKAKLACIFFCIRKDEIITPFGRNNYPLWTK